MKLIGAGVMLAVAVTTNVASAQIPRTMLRVGDRVRLTTLSMPLYPVVGRVAATDDSQLTVAGERSRDEFHAPQQAFDWTSIRRLERSEGYESSAGKGAVTGAGAGFLIGGLWFAAALYGVPLFFIAPPVETILICGAAGAVIGASSGASNRNERWSPVSLRHEHMPIGPPRPAGSTLAIGDRVRLTTPIQDSSPIVGQIVESDDERLTIVTVDPDASEPGPEHQIDWDVLTGIERSQGFQSKTGAGLLLGAGLGAAVGAVLAHDEDRRTMIQVPLAGACVGGITGAIIGTKLSGERWKPMPLDSRVAPALPSSDQVLARSANTGSHAVAGGLIGAGVGLLGGLMATSRLEPEAAGYGALLFCSLGVGAGMLVGAAIGSTIPSQAAALPALQNAQVGVTVGPANVPMLAIRTTF